MNISTLGIAIMITVIGVILIAFVIPKVASSVQKHRAKLDDHFNKEYPKKECIFSLSEDLNLTPSVHDFEMHLKAGEYHGIITSYDFTMDVIGVRYFITESIYITLYLSKDMVRSA